MLCVVIHNHMILGLYEKLLKILYCEIANEIVVGNLLEVVDLSVFQPPKRKKKSHQPQPDVKIKDNI